MTVSSLALVSVTVKVKGVVPLFPSLAVKLATLAVGGERRNSASNPISTSEHAGQEAFLGLVDKPQRHGVAEHARSRVLNDNELRAIWKAAGEAGTFGAVTRFLLLTACRRGEAASLPWSEIVDGVWHLPPGRNKTKQPLARPLSRAALALLDTQPRLAGVPYVFTVGDGPWTSFSVPKKLLDTAAGVAGWRLHDLRRTARTLLSRAGVNADIAERCLGHVLGGVRGTYDRHRYQTEMLHAYEALAAQIERIVDPQQPNVVTLRSRP